MSERIRLNNLKVLRRSVYTPLSTLLLTFIISSCTEILETPSQTTRSSQSYADIGEGYVYLDSPSALTGNDNVSTADFTSFLQTEFITFNNNLESSCTFTQSTSGTASSSTDLDTSCFRILNDSKSSTIPLTPVDGSWAFSQEENEDEFYQVNTYYHVNKVVERFHDALSFAHKTVHFSNTLLAIPPATKFNFLATESYWLNDGDTPQTMKVFAKCFLEDMNAFFDPAQATICMGFNNDDVNFRMVQDPTVIYHEVGHSLVKVMLNQRNTEVGNDPTNFGASYSDIIPYESDLGYVDYDEAGSINEGIADYFSYVMTNRKQMGTYAFTKLGLNARPLTEDNSNHTALVSSATGERLSYPNFVHYNSTLADVVEEDVHNSGQIITHYLVALTEKMKDVCSFSSSSSDTIHSEATDQVLMVINETLAELGDLTGKGSDYLSMYATNNANLENVFFVNMNRDHSFEWQSVANPINFRKFAQTMAKNIFHHITSNTCGGVTQDVSEQLLDEYGLLLFRTYNDHRGTFDIAGNSTTYYTSFAGAQLTNIGNTTNMLVTSGTAKIVAEANRKNSVLVSKDFIVIDDDISLYLFDGRTEISNILANLTFEGENVTTTEGIAGVEYNNNNIKISPGEVVGLAMNIFNDSNSPIGGVQLLANDWDHMKLNDTTSNYVYSTTNSSAGKATATHSPCIVDDFPKESEGGVSDDDSSVSGNCSHITKTNDVIDDSDISGTTVYAQYEDDAPQPICLVQFSDDNETKWVSQDFFRRHNMSLEDKDCLNNPSMSNSNFNPNSCLIRILPGANQAIYGKIDSQKNFVDTLEGSTEFNSSNVVLMEVNKWIMPGTTFTCRMRVRHSNCSDCFDTFDGSDFTELLDFEYAGSDPYKVINFKFTVID